MIESDFTSLPHDSNDLLWRQLKTIPAFRALLRSVEARFYHAVDLPQPTLDVGCGDGHFAEFTFEQPITAGIDPWWNPLKKAQASHAYQLPLQALGDSLPFADHTFASAFSNSVLEHIPDIQPVLDEVSRVMQPGAPFVLTVPSHHFTGFLAGAGFFERLGLDSLAGFYRKTFNRISRHAHTDPPKVWNERLALAGFKVERWQYYFSPDALRALELGHAQGIPSAVIHALTGHWILGPWESNLRRTERWVRPYYEEEFPEQGAYIYFLARKTEDEPLTATLPPPRPYALAELQQAEDAPTAEDEGPGVESPAGAVDDPESDGEIAADVSTTSTATDTPTGKASHLLVPGLLVAGTLLFASMGQAALRATPDQPAQGLRWFAVSAIGMLLLLLIDRSTSASGTRAWQLPDLGAVSRRRWLVLPALLLALIAYGFSASANYLSPLVPLGLWIAAMALTAFALSADYSPAKQAISLQSRTNRIFTVKAAVLLFLLALLLRIVDLGSHPSFLNGTEASIGLEALDVLAGLRDNPFSAGWLTNPTLPFFLLALPLRLLGPSAESVRLLSAFIGALTVPALFVIGQSLYGRMVGLVAAILLAGCHFHIHFSRSGLTNAWDALLVLLSLGLIAIAWEKPPRGNRGTWLWAGTAVGLSAYLYTSSHLLPIMLLALCFIVLFFDRATLKKQWRHLLAMALMAFVVALPQILFYQAMPDVFMERADTLGILANQNGWLNAEATRTGVSQVQLLGDQFWKAALAFVATIDTGTSYGPRVPLLNFLFSLLAVLGSILALFRLGKIKYSILIVWVSVTIIFAGALLENPPNSHRLIITIPALSLLAAIALNELVSAVTGQKDQQNDSATVAQNHRARWIYLVVTLLVATTIAMFDIGFYFGTYREKHSFGDRNTEIADTMATYLNNLEGSWVAQFYGPPGMFISFPTIPFLVHNFEAGINLFDVPENGAPMPGFEDERQTFIFLPERYNEIDQLRTRYPAGQEQIFSGYYAEPLFYVYEVREGS